MEKWSDLFPTAYNAAVGHE